MVDEYFCPNCGAILNNQDGFDPAEGTWRCTKCGEFLMGGDIYYGERFEGIAWYCDDCGALLNRQSGFSDRYDTWNCTASCPERWSNPDRIFLPAVQNHEVRHQKQKEWILPDLF